MEEQEKTILELKCREAYTRDVSRGIIRIDYFTMDKLNVTTGDTIMVEGKSKTVGKCLPLYPSDESKGMVRMDGLLRSNCGITIGDTITIKKTKSVFAEKVVVVPLEAIPPVDERYLAEALNTVPVVLNQKVIIPYFGGRLTFKVTSTVPQQMPVVITTKTVFVINQREEDVVPALFCKFCKKEVPDPKLRRPFCDMDHKIRWTIRDELKTMGIKEVKIE